MPYSATKDDGIDRIFGDVGNDWLVGGTGKDDLYGGYGNDLINADDYHDTETAGVAALYDNESPDTQPFFEDRAYGGAGRDVIIGNTGGDRLIDWVGEFNTFLVPYAPFGTASVSRTLQPQLAEFLYALSGSDGVDPTRATDTGGNAARNGEPAGELGLLRQQDKDPILKGFGADFHSQTGAPADPQAGNIPGGKRDVLRSATFDNNKPENLMAESGTWKASGGVLQVGATSLHGDAVAVYQIGDALPMYFEVAANIKTIKPTAGWNANSYIIFDYISYKDFKFAGIDVSTNKLVIGHRDASGWITDSQTPFLAKSDRYYSVLLSVNGLTATVIVDNKSLTYAFNARIEVGVSYGLNWGQVGFGSNNARGAMDNIAVQVLPAQTNIVSTTDFVGGSGGLFDGDLTGTWTLGNGRFDGSPATPSGYAINMIDMSGVTRLSSTAVLDLSTVLKTTTLAGVVFDRNSNGDFKWAAFDVQNKQVLVGHYANRGGWVTDKAVGMGSLAANTDYTLRLFIKGSTVTVSVTNLAGTSSAMLSHSFNAVAVDGGFGLLVKGGSASFDKVTAKTDDTQVPQSLMASTAALSSSANSTTATISDAELQPLIDEALRRWSMSQDASLIDPLRGLQVRVADLPGLELGWVQDGVIVIDVDAAGHGWFVDATPNEHSEFLIPYGPDTLAATRSSEAFGHMDLLTVVMHEMGHVVGLEDVASPDGTYALMGATLAPGVRHATAVPIAAHDEAVPQTISPAVPSRATGGKPKPVLVFDEVAGLLRDLDGQRRPGRNGDSAYAVPSSALSGFAGTRQVRPQFPEFSYVLSDRDGTNRTQGGSEPGGSDRRTTPVSAVGLLPEIDRTVTEDPGISPDA